MTPPSLSKYVVWKKKKDSVLFSLFEFEFTWDFFAFRHAESVWILRHKNCIINLDIERIELCRDATRALIIWRIRKYILLKRSVGFPTLFILPILIVLISTFRNAFRRKIPGDLKGAEPLSSNSYSFVFFKFKSFLNLGFKRLFHR